MIALLNWNIIRRHTTYEIFPNWDSHNRLFGIPSLGIPDSKPIHDTVVDDVESTDLLHLTWFSQPVFMGVLYIEYWRRLEFPIWYINRNVHIVVWKFPELQNIRALNPALQISINQFGLQLLDAAKDPMIVVIRHCVTMIANHMLNCRKSFKAVFIGYYI